MRDYGVTKKEETTWLQVSVHGEVQDRWQNINKHFN